MVKRAETPPEETDEKISEPTPDCGVTAEVDVDEEQVAAAAEALLQEEEKLVGSLRKKIAKTEGELSRLKNLLEKLTKGRPISNGVGNGPDLLPAPAPIPQPRGRGLRGFAAAGARGAKDMQVLKMVEAMGGG